MNNTPEKRRLVAVRANSESSSRPIRFGTFSRRIDEPDCLVNVDPDRSRSYDLSPQDIVNALDRGTYSSRSGNVTIKDQMTVVPSDTMVVDPQELRNAVW